MSETATPSEPLVGMTARVTDAMKRRIKSEASLAGMTVDKWLAEAAAEKLTRSTTSSPDQPAAQG